MTQGEGLVALLYAFKGILMAGATWVLTGAALIIFFWIISKFLGSKVGLFGGSGGFGGGSKIDSKSIMYGLFILFVIFGIYSLIALTGDIFGVNSSPSGGIYVSR